MFINKIKEEVAKRPFITSIILAIILFGINLPALGWIVILIGFIVFLKKKDKISKNKKDSKIKEAEDYIEKIKENKSLPVVQSSLLLENSESVFLEEASSMSEPRAVRKSSGGGAGFRVMKGVYLGGYSGSSKSTQEWQDLDDGTLTLTNKRVLFRGQKENKTIHLNKIISVQYTSNSIEMVIDNKTKPVKFTVSNPYIWTTAIRVNKSVNDPLNLGNLEIDIKIQT